MGFALLQRYIFMKALWSTLAITVALTGVVWVVRAVQQVDVLLSDGQGIITYLQMTTLGVPTLAAAVAPLALMIALIRTINSLNEDSELVVMHASGAPRRTLLKPFLAVALLIGVLVYVLSLWVGPSSMATLRGFITEVRADLVSVLVREGRFQDVGKGLTFHVGEREPGGILKSVFVLDGRDEKETFTYLARQGAVTREADGTYLVLQDGQIQRQTADSENISIIRFNSYAFNLSSFSGSKKVVLRSQLELPTSQLISPDPELELYKRAPGRLRAELHTRLTSGIYPMMVVMMVLAFLRNPGSHRQGNLLAVIAVSLITVGLRTATIVGESGLRSNPAMLFLVWGVPISAILAAAYIVIADIDLVSARIQSRFNERLAAALSGAANLWRGMRSRRWVGLRGAGE